MKRDIYQHLKEWKLSEARKPLLLMGARQTGKTYILKEFGRTEYKNLIYCNFEEEPELKEFFKGSLKPTRILESLALYKRTEIRPVVDLLFFDEIQDSNGALNSLKYFNEEASAYHVVAAGSLLGVKVSTPLSFPVGKVSLLDLHPMTFLEFLDAMDEHRYRKVLEEVAEITPFASPLHDELVNLLKMYYFVGGMPEAVARFAKSRSYENVRSIQKSILRTYELDFAKHAPTTDIPKLSLIWSAIPGYLARENKKFMFSALAGGARARDYESALQWLNDAGLINLAYGIEKVELPLSGFANKAAFKVYTLDVGLLAAMAGITIDILAKQNELFATYRGAFVENFAAQQLVAARQLPLYYWKSESRKAEIDFLYDTGTAAYPLEVKAGINPHSKSLAAYTARFSPGLRLRSTLLNFKKDDNTLNIPLYALNCIDRYVSLAQN